MSTVTCDPDVVWVGRSAPTQVDGLARMPADGSLAGPPAGISPPGGRPFATADAGGAAVGVGERGRRDQTAELFERPRRARLAAQGGQSAGGEQCRQQATPSAETDT